MSNLEGILNLARETQPRMRRTAPYTKRFLKWNRAMLRAGRVSYYADTTRLYNPLTRGFVKKKYDRRNTRNPRLVARQRAKFGSVLQQIDPNQHIIYTTEAQREDDHLVRTLVGARQLQGDWRIIVKSGYRILVDGEYDIAEPSLSVWWNEVINDFREDSEHMKWWIGPITIIFTRRINVPARYFAQAFRDGIHHCFFHPILNWAEDGLKAAKTKSAKNKWTTIIHKIKGKKLKDRKKLKNRYKSGYLQIYKDGIPENDLSIVVKELNIGLKIFQPFADKPLIDIKPHRKGRKTFKFINTRLNHIEKPPEWFGFDNIRENHNAQSKINSLFIEGQDGIICTREELESLVIKNKDCIYGKDHQGVCRVKTLTDIYCLDNEFLDTCNEFEKETGLKDCKIDKLEYPNLSAFIAEGTHWNGTKDFKNVADVLLVEAKHIDQEKAYTQFKKCRWYNQFLGKITDFRKVPDDFDIKTHGLYYIDKLDFKKAPKKFRKLIKKLGWFYDRNIYTHAELIMLKEMKVKFVTKYGAYGLPIDFEFNEDMTNKKEDMVTATDKYKGLPYYSKWTGLIASTGKWRAVYMRGREQKYLETLKYQSTNGTFVKITERDDEAKISFKKICVYNLQHISAQITAYQRLHMLEQLLEMDYDKLIRVCVDGIYYYPHEFKEKETFTDKTEKMTLENKECRRYLSSIFESEHFARLSWNRTDMADYYPHYLRQLLLGAGGTGKTYNTLKNKGFINLCYVSPSWKLAADKKRTYKSNVNVKARFFHKNYKKSLENKYSILFWDEASMITEGGKEEIFKLNAKHIFAGDLKYQLPPVIDGDMKEKGGKWIYQMTEEGFDNVETLIKNWRNGDCKKLTKILNGLRKMIDKIKECSCPINCRHSVKEFFGKDFPYKRFQVIEKLSQSKFKIIKPAPHKFLGKTYLGGQSTIGTTNENHEYHKEDLIICAEGGSNNKNPKAMCNVYTKQFKDIPKFKVTQNSIDHCNGDIVFGKTKGVAMEHRHGYTIHSIQGEDAEHKLFIDMTKMKSLQMFYTALSRARKWEQIFLIKPACKE